MSRENVPFRSRLAWMIGCVTLLGVAEHATAQGPCDPCSGSPTTCGTWSLVYDLSDDVTEGGLWPYTSEIVHAAVLPPDDMEAQVIQRVVFICSLGYDCAPAYIAGDEGIECVPETPQSWGRSYLWRPNRNPVNALPIPVPPTFPQDGSQAFFCGGHAFLDDGTWLFAGGTDYLRTCSPQPSPECGLAGGSFFGHKYAWALDTRTPMPTWSQAGQGVGTDSMERERWYPTVTLLSDGTAIAAGHTLEPSIPGPDGHAFWRDEYDPVSNTWVDAGYQNLEEGSCLSGAEAVSLGNYPRLFMLPNRLLMYANPTPGAPGAVPSRYMNLDENMTSAWWACPGSETDPSLRRWRAGSTPTIKRVDSGAALLVTWDSDNDEFHWTVYLTGGSDEFFPDDQCEQVTMETNILSSVERIKDPMADTMPEWEGVNAMCYSRANHNTVILLDGSLLVVGGKGKVGTECVARLTPERYEPFEVFGGANPVWVPQAPQLCERGYHSVAGLLADGRVFSAGGLGGGICNTVYSGHSAEVFTPPYAARSDRPVIDLDSVEPLVTKAYTDPLDFNVQLTVGRMIDRVALLRNGSMTHAFDMDQRYVELRILADPIENPPGSGQYSVSVQMPDDGYTAPPGYYMMTVVDSAQLPSSAAWIHLDQP